MSFFPGKDPDGRRCLWLRRHRPCGGAAHGRSRRRLHGAPGAALGAFAHGRSVHFFRSFWPGGISRRQRPRRPPASAYRACHRLLSVRRRNHAPRQPRHGGGDQAGRGQLDDGRSRHRAFRAHRRGETRDRRARSMDCRCGSRLPAAKEEMDAGFAHHDAGEFPVIADNGKTVRVVVGSLYGATSPVPVVHETIFADVCLKAGGTLPLDADHEERAIYVIDGTHRHCRRQVRGRALLVFKPGDKVTVSAASDAHFVLVGGAADGRPAPHLVEFRVIAERAHRASQGRLEGRALQQGAGRRDRVHSAAGEIDHSTEIDPSS